MNTIPPTTPEGNDLDRLREQFPGWWFGRHWTTAGSGPDGHCLFAIRGDIILSALDAPSLAALIRRHEQ
jgi:hypothetical protein